MASPLNIDADSARLFQINISDGGVPKLPIMRVAVDFSGAKGDRQRNLRFHGGPDRALCLYSLERILALQGEGHSIVPGATGENLTLAGLDWDRVQPGLRLTIGEMLNIEITDYTKPCRDIASSFANGAIKRIFQERYPGWSRVYAKVIQPGEITVGDSVRLENGP
ncbi:MAG: MOSC domain-containing protein [Acidobacteria bacterium]|nr:MOSC domain-containing protein [Acidobacteriota bacterium]